MHERRGIHYFAYFRLARVAEEVLEVGNTKSRTAATVNALFT